LGGMSSGEIVTRTTALITFGAFARVAWAPDYPIGIEQQAIDQTASEFADSWGTGASLRVFSASRAHDTEAQFAATATRCG
jgi:hypothetical protein